MSTEELPRILWNVITHRKLYSDPTFGEFVLDDDQASDLLQLARRGRELETGDHLWLNRQLVQAAFAATKSGGVFHKTKTEFDAVIVSDAGKQFTISRRTRAGGLVGVALRATDILMNRVWQLENDSFGSEPGFLFVPMSMTVPLADDPTALHPEVQRQVTNTRTDLDRFSDLEISGLVRHGYGVMRQVCRSRPELFGDRLPRQETRASMRIATKASGAFLPGMIAGSHSHRPSFSGSEDLPMGVERPLFVLAH